MQNFETVLAVEHYTDDLFWFRTTKTKDWKRMFIPGEFTMIGMGDDDIQRAYSIANSPDDDWLEFLSIKVQDGPLTSRLQNIKVGDELEISTRPIGTLLLRNLNMFNLDHEKPRLWMISTGTGLAPFLSLARHPEAYEYYDEVIVTHTCRTNAECVFRDELEAHGAKVYQTVTREDASGPRHYGRITEKIRDGSLFRDTGTDGDKFDLTRDRIMICGGPSFNNELRGMLEDMGMEHGTMKSPGHFVQERAFVELSSAS
jgi:ferredoxin--NADP+ reductase